MFPFKLIRLAENILQVPVQELTHTAAPRDMGASLVSSTHIHRRATSASSSSCFSTLRPVAILAVGTGPVQRGKAGRPDDFVCGNTRGSVGPGGHPGDLGWAAEQVPRLSGPQVWLLLQYHLLIIWTKGTEFSFSSMPHHVAGPQPGTILNIHFPRQARPGVSLKPPGLVHSSHMRTDTVAPSADPPSFVSPWCCRGHFMMAPLPSPAATGSGQALLASGRPCPASWLPRPSHTIPSRPIKCAPGLAQPVPAFPVLGSALVTVPSAPYSLSLFSPGYTCWPCRS